MKSTMMKGARPRAVFDRDNHRFIISPLLPTGRMTLSDAFRAIKESPFERKKISWRAIGKFMNISQSHAFKVAYCTKRDGYIIRKALIPYLVIDEAKGEAYLYDYLHKPESVVPTHVGPLLINGEAEKQTITQEIPTKVSSRVRVKYPFSASLVMTLKPQNGYLLGIKDVVIAPPNVVYKVTGSASALTDLLTRLHFVAVEPGDATLTIAVDDGAKAITSVVSTTVSITVEEGEKISVPELALPEAPKATIHEESKFDPIKINDEDGKLFQFRITPFGCKIIGFKNNLHPLMPGQVSNLYGRAETINEDIANLSIIPYQENAQIGIELISGTFKLREYIVFDIAVPEEPEDEEESTEDPNAPTTQSASNPDPDDLQAGSAESGPVENPESVEGTPAVQSDEGQAIDDGEPAVESTLSTPYVTSTVQSISGVASGTAVDMPIRITGADEVEVACTLKPIRCTLTNTTTNTNTAHNKTLNISGTVASANQILEALKINVGTQEGRVDVTLNGQVQSLPVVPLTPPAEDQSTEASA